MTEIVIQLLLLLLLHSARDDLFNLKNKNEIPQLFLSFFLSSSSSLLTQSNQYAPTHARTHTRARSQHEHNWNTTRAIKHAHRALALFPAPPLLLLLLLQVKLNSGLGSG